MSAVAVTPLCITLALSLFKEITNSQQHETHKKAEAAARSLGPAGRSQSSLIRSETRALATGPMFPRTAFDLENNQLVRCTWEVAR